ncbi:hypothetical protein [Actinomycetospora chibensis]|uniref:Uncharacterized protein n=1 Tax=Actinomycetospora chibensis TaxID=663606 RepID=A0ABV9RTF6_9PSEU|nr:hypothetical protein [Actinomycetospora chibensis]MDD7926483.1 hypothetical protein [Actinomycetospora chibensis]
MAADLDAETVAFPLPDPGAETCRDVARALAPYTRPDRGLVLSGSAAAALAEVFRRLARDGGEVPDVAVRAARRLLTDLAAADCAAAECADRAGTSTRTAPTPRSPSDRDPEVLAAR